MDFDSIIALSAKLAALALFVYGLIIFADQAAGQLITGRVAYVVSPFIWGSSWDWLGAGAIAFDGLLMASAGFLALRFKPKRSDSTNEFAYLWPFLRALLDTLILFFTFCLTWELLLFTYEPDTMYMQVIVPLRGSVISNMFVMNFSAIMLALLSGLKLRRFLLGWLPPWPTSKRFALSFGLLSLSLGTVIFVIAFYLANSFGTVSTLAYPRYFSCDEECYFVSTLDLTLGGIGAILVLVGAIVSIERLLPRELEL